jgi:hypothetical protein
MRDILSAYDATTWRRIDNDWLMSAGQLALQVDNAVNNTSLVLAFELIESRKVLLFVGDAQVGNWKSWQEPTFNPIIRPPDGISDAEWREVVRCTTAVEDLYIDYQVPT